MAAGVLPVVQALRREVEGHLTAATGGELVRWEHHAATASACLPVLKKVWTWQVVTDCCTWLICCHCRPHPLLPNYPSLLHPGAVCASRLLAHPMLARAAYSTCWRGTKLLLCRLLLGQPGTPCLYSLSLAGSR